MKTEKCIYCNQSNDFNKEHPLPYAFGEFEGLPTLNDRICIKCNSTIGGIEEQFLRSGPEAFFRKYLGITGRKEHKPKNIFMKGSNGAPPIDFIASLPEDKKIDVLWQLDSEKNTVQEVRQIIFLGKKGIQHPLRIHDYMLNSYQDFKESILNSKIDFSQIKEVRIFCAPEEMNKIKEFLQSWGKFEYIDESEYNVIEKSILQFTVTDKYFRSLVKVGFHLLLSVSDQFIGNEEYFKPVRDYIFNGFGKIPVTETDVSILPNRVIPKKWSHFLVILIKSNIIQIRLQFFVSQEMNPKIYEFTLVETNSAIFIPFYQIYLCNYIEYEGKWRPDKATPLCIQQKELIQ